MLVVFFHYLLRIINQSVFFLFLFLPAVSVRLIFSIHKALNIKADYIAIHPH